MARHNPTPTNKSQKNKISGGRKSNFLFQDDEFAVDGKEGFDDEYENEEDSRQFAPPAEDADERHMSEEDRRHLIEEDFRSSRGSCGDDREPDSAAELAGQKNSGSKSKKRGDEIRRIGVEGDRVVHRKASGRAPSKRAGSKRVTSGRTTRNPSAGRKTKTLQSPRAGRGRTTGRTSRSSSTRPVGRSYAR